MSSILIIGWGSLVWSPKSLLTKGNWQLNGPTLPIEFSRISLKGRLTLVVDEKNGVPINTRTIQSGCETLADAIENLRVREGAPSAQGIGYVDRRAGTFSPHALKNHGPSIEVIGEWLDSTGADAVIWTAIGPRWTLPGQFTVEAAAHYLAEMREPLRTEGHEYVRNAPPEVATPVRRRFEEIMLTRPVVSAS